MKINIAKCLLRRIEMNVKEINDVYNNLNKKFQGAKVEKIYNKTI